MARKPSDGAIQDALRDLLSQLGRRGGKARAKSLTENERREIATAASEARWAKWRGDPKRSAKAKEIARAAAKKRWAGHKKKPR